VDRRLAVFFGSGLRGAVDGDRRRKAASAINVVPARTRGEKCNLRIMRSLLNVIDAYRNIVALSAVIAPPGMTLSSHAEALELLHP